MAAPFTVVGIGASAGGLEALQAFFDAVPADSGMAYVVVVHLSPDHESHLPALLQRHTEMPTTQVASDEQIVPNHIYVIPPNRNLSTIDTHLRLSPLEEARRARAPIDHFFRTLAETHDVESVAIVLSGSGMDGASGLRRIKEAGGLTVAQEPSEAAYDSMPQSAINTGCVDLILPVAAMPARIATYISTTPRPQLAVEGENLADDTLETLQKIFVQLRLAFGHDFSHYKRSTLMRRIGRRMQLHGVEELNDYLHILRADPKELDALFNDVLITVTNFFRDPEAFAALEHEVIPNLLADSKQEKGVRVWTVGCATGEEAYSIAMLLLEASDRLSTVPPIQVFASDISGGALISAREGLFPKSIINDVSPERLERFFVEESNGYRVRSTLREMVLFAPHNLLKDPPFSKLDLVVCRNLLIYLLRNIHRKVYEIFHYALKPNGYLFLGSSESPDDTELFHPLNKKSGVYQRLSIGSSEPRLPSLPLSLTPILPDTEPRYRSPVEVTNYGVLHGRMVERYAPPSVLVNRDYNLIHISANAGRYLQQPGGEPTNNILQRVRDELRIELTAALYGAFEKGRTIHTQSIRVRLDGENRLVCLNVRPSLDLELKDFVLVIFEEYELDQAGSEKLGVMGTATHPSEQQPFRMRLGEHDTTVRELEEELRGTKQRLRTTIEEFETSKEEMRASNEELQSMNEELKSTAEELETSREELQSMNEELVAVNQENKNKVDELAQLSSDLRNLLDATDIATLFLDRELRIKRFTPRISELFNILSTDRGRSLGDLTHKLGYDGLLDDAHEVLRRLVPIEREVHTVGDRWHLMRVLPYRTLDDHIDGVVITFVDISTQKAAEATQRMAREHAESLIDAVPDPLLILDNNLRVENANQSFYQFFQVQPEQVLSQPVYQLGNWQWNNEQLRQLLEDVLPTNTTFNSYEVEHIFDRIGRRVLHLSGRQLGHLQLIILAIHDITARKVAEEKLGQLTASLEEQVVKRTSQARQLAAQLTMVEQQERQRLAHILHDDLQQQLYSIQMKLNFVQASINDNDLANSLKELNETEEWLNNCVTLTRQLSVDLSPPILAHEDLGDALGWLARQMREIHGLEVTLTVEHAFGVENLEKRLLLYQAVRELLFNVVKYAGVDQATLSLKAEDGQIVIEVADEGNGFDVKIDSEKNRQDGGLGLISIRERLNLFGGQMIIDSAPGEGTCITLKAPFG